MLIQTIKKIYTGVPQSSKLFQFILLADDTTLLTKKGINTNLMNRELCKISMWFKVNKLCLNVPKSKRILFHQP